MITHVSRDGVVLGKFRDNEIVPMLRTGLLRWTDYYWKPGMKDWRRLHEWPLPAPACPPRTTPEPKAEGESYGSFLLKWFLVGALMGLLLPGRSRCRCRSDYDVWS